jgi:uncharacterized caspase-like protein
MRARSLQSLPLAALMCWALHSTCALSADAARPRAALVIGNAHYSAVNPLRNTLNDAHDMCEALSELGYTASCLADLRDAREFRARIQEFAASLKPKSEVLFYYAGHAIQVKGESYLVPVSAKLRAEADVATETVPLAFVMAQLLQAKHYVNIMILDACRSNPWQANPRGLSAGLAPITAIPRGTMIMYGTATNDVSDDGEGRNGTLTKNLLANIRSPGLTADEFFKRVSAGVQSDSAAGVGHTQTPALYTNFSGEFCFAGCIDRVARAELERIQKAHEEQLAQARAETAELEASNRAAQDQLAATTASMYCDPSPPGGRCFAASSQRTAKAIVTTLAQRGFDVGGAYNATGRVEAIRSVDDPKDKTLTDVLSVTASVVVASTDHCLVTITAKQRSLVHDKRHHWTSADIIIPIQTSTEYKEVVRKDVDVDDQAFFSELYSAIERNLRSDAVLDTVEAPKSPAATADASP